MKYPTEVNSPCALCGINSSHVYDLPDVGLDMCWLCIQEAAKHYRGANFPLCDYCDVEWVKHVTGLAALCDHCYRHPSVLIVGAKMLEGRFPNPELH